MAKSFIIVISIILIVQIVSICSFLRLCPVAKAGKVSKFYWKYRLLLGKEPKEIVCNGDVIDVSSLKELYVHGNSMKDHHILNGQKVFVSVYDTPESKESINDYPVLVFHRFNMKGQSPYKLRKFVGYVGRAGGNDWNNLYHKYKERIKIDEESFLSEMQEKERHLQQNLNQHILSETYDEETGKYRYSLHSVDSLYAKVMYAI